MAYTRVKVCIQCVYVIIIQYSVIDTVTRIYSAVLDIHVLGCAVVVEKLGTIVNQRFKKSQLVMENLRASWN